MMQSLHDSKFTRRRSGLYVPDRDLVTDRELGKWLEDHPRIAGGAPGLFRALAGSSTATVTNSVADTNIISQSIPANYLLGSAGTFIGAMIELNMMGNADNVVTATPSFSVWVKIGSTKIATITWVFGASAGTNLPWEVTFLFTCRTVGVTGSVICTGTGALPAAASCSTGGTAAASFSYTAVPTATTVDTTAAQSLAIGMSWSAASASNTGRCMSAAMEPVASGL